MKSNIGISLEIDGIYCVKCNDFHPKLFWHEKYNDYVNKTKHVERIVQAYKRLGGNISIDDACKNYTEHLHILGIDEMEISEKCVICSEITRFKSIKTNHYVCSNECKYAEEKKCR